MRLLVLLASCLVILASSGCTRWQAPEDGASATLTFTANQLSAQPMICDGKAMRSTPQALGISQPGREHIYQDINQRLGKAEAVNADIPVDQPLIVGVRYTDRSGSTRRVCRSAVRFKPAADAHYQAHFHAESGQCTLRVSDPEDNPVGEVSPWRCP